MNMQSFIGTKRILAMPMNRSEYNVYRGWELPADENGDDTGYLVEYTDGGKPNHPSHNGYVSWSPTDVFDNTYISAQGLSYGLAFELARKGFRIARSSWNGRGQYLILIPGAHLAKSAGYGFGEYMGEFTFADTLALKNAQNIMVVGWTPSSGDQFGLDWYVVGDDD